MTRRAPRRNRLLAIRRTRAATQDLSRIKHRAAAVSNNGSIGLFWERPMYERILVPMDGSVTAINGLREAIRLAGCGRDSQLELLHVIDDLPTFQTASGQPPGERQGDRRQAAEKMLRGHAELARHAIAAVRTHVCRADEWAADSILESAVKFECGLIVMGTHGRSGVRRALLGSVAEQVSRSSPVPVMLVPSSRDVASNDTRANADDAPYKRILVPFDGSACSKFGLDEAIRLAGQMGATLSLVHVVDLWAVAATPQGGGALTADLAEQLRGAGQNLLDAATTRVRAAGGDAQTRLFDNLSERVSKTIVNEAMQWQADLIVIGTHGRRGVSRWALGSDAEQIARHSPVPVLMVRQGA